MLGEPFKELERQTIYFASSEQLNDPMEGFRDIVWRGDRIVWTNLFKNYVYCLNWIYINFKILGDDVELRSSLNPAAARWHEPLTPQFGDLFDEVWDSVNDTLRLADLIEDILSLTGGVRRDELVFYLHSIHLKVLARIQEVYVNRGLSPETERPTHASLIGRSVLTEENFFELIAQLETEFEDFSRVTFSISSRMMAAQLLRHKYNLRTSGAQILGKNRQLLALDFPNLYVERLENMLWPSWYAACFTKGYHNSSVWGSYGDSHRGGCLIFETDDADESSALSLRQRVGWTSSRGQESKELWDFVPRVFRDISYSDKQGEVDFFRNIGRLPVPALMNLWYTDEAGNVSECATHVGPDMDYGSWMKRYWADFDRDIVLKSKDWDHEKECRLILHGLLDDTLDNCHRTLTYEFKSLKGVIFGIKTSDDDKVRIIEIVERKCRASNRTDFQFHQAYYSPEYGDIRKYDLRIQFAGVGEVDGN